MALPGVGGSALGCMGTAVPAGPPGGCTFSPGTAVLPVRPHWGRLAELSCVFPRGVARWFCHFPARGAHQDTGHPRGRPEEGA